MTPEGIESRTKAAQSITKEIAAMELLRKAIKPRHECFFCHTSRRVRAAVKRFKTAGGLSWH